MIPTILYGNWSILFITFTGTLLALSSASLKEWRLEKYQARRHAEQSYALFRGNGNRHVFVIQEGNPVNGKYPGLYLDDLAGAVRKADRLTRGKVGVLAFIWVVFLITAGGLDENTWFLLLVGVIGMAQNIWVAGCHQSSDSHGIPVDIRQTYGLKTLPPNRIVPKSKRHFESSETVYEATSAKKLMKVLMEVEEIYPSVGARLVPEYFQDKLRPHEEAWWNAAKLKAKNPPKYPFSIRPGPWPPSEEKWWNDALSHDEDPRQHPFPQDLHRPADEKVWYKAAQLNDEKRDEYPKPGPVPWSLNESTWWNTALLYAADPTNPAPAPHRLTPNRDKWWKAVKLHAKEPQNYHFPGPLPWSADEIQWWEAAKLCTDQPQKYPFPAPIPWLQNERTWWDTALLHVADPTNPPPLPPRLPAVNDEWWEAVELHSKEPQKYPFPGPLPWSANEDQWWNAARLHVANPQQNALPPGVP
jgi:hypothetical protein